MASSTRIRETGGTARRQRTSKRQSAPSVKEDKPQFIPTRIQKFYIAAQDYGWDYEERWYALDYQIKAWRNDGEERIRMVWRDRNFSGEESYYELVDVRTKAIQNQAEAIRFMEDQPDYTGAVDEDGNVVIIRDVFDWDDSTDEEVMNTLRGRVVRWQNSYTGEHESATVPRRGRWTHVQTSSAGNRFITFADAGGGGFRSVHLSAINRIK